MDFDGRSPIVRRIAFLAASVLAFGFFAFQRQELVPGIVFLLVAAYQGKLILDMFSQPRQRLVDTVEFDDLTYSFRTTSPDAEVQRLCDDLNQILSRMRNSRQERDSEFLFFRNIVMHVGIGLIVVKEDGKIEIFNGAARRLLRTNRVNTIDDLKEVSVPLVDVIRRLKTGGSELLRLKLHDDIVQLSVYAIELTLKGENVKLVSLQNIQSELEEKEMEAWQNLVRVLTHEIMNSVTPISSLAGTIESDLKQHFDEESDQLSEDEMRDIHLSLQTISKRSEALIRFVKEFRSLTSIPKPKPVMFSARALLEEVGMLHKSELTEKGINIAMEVYPEDLTILADRGMIEQVLINLVKNAIQSFDDQVDKTLTLRAFVSDKSRPVIVVKDNGPGIDPDALEKIFIPFFTTKKTGSGIGLSLSRQIMRQHQGTLTVKSEVGKGTEFYLRF
ncbi:MAG: ATP-binding protein [Cyclobacteriaceae bacterium]|jgi:nitrogen fixation/metabolism regulation signal transduction histidine kinase|nr:ATP-binding protein [Cyclobacteriaceae bacterium]